MKFGPTISWCIVLFSAIAAAGCGVQTGVVATSTINAGGAQATPPPDLSEPGILPTATQTQAAQPVLPESSGSLAVAYIDPDLNLWTWREGAEPRQLTTSGDVENTKISSDGSWIAFTRTTNFIDYSLWAIKADGSGETVLMDKAALDALPRPTEAVGVIPYTFAWVPGSHILGFNTRPAFEGLGLMLNDDLWLVNADTGERQQLLAPGEGGMFYFSPDGSRIAISTPDTISLIGIDGSNRQDRVLTFPRVSTYSEYLFYPEPRWSPDASFLRVVIPPAAIIENPDDPAQVWHIPADGTPASQVGSFVTQMPIYPVLSPDLSKVAYLKQVGDQAENRRELHIANADGSEDVVYLADTNLMFTAWAPDSARFAFTIGDNMRPYTGQVGTGPQPLTDTMSALNIRWIGDQRFLFITLNGSSVELRLGTVGEPSKLVATASGVSGRLLSFDVAR